MVYHTYRPSQPLAAFVEKFWLYDGAAPAHARERRLPGGSMELVINLRDEAIQIADRQLPDQFRRFGGSVLSGAYAEHFIIDTSSQTSLLGVHFKPGGAFPFFPLPASELYNAQVSLETLWGTAANALREQVLAAPTPECTFQILERFLLTQASRPLAQRAAITFALHAFHSAPCIPSVADVTEQVGLSARRFIQVFNEEVGLTPKLYCRIRRFQQVLGSIDPGKQIEWAEIALTCGYYDQAHLIHDFQAFAGLTPQAYLTQRGEYANHVPLRD